MTELRINLIKSKEKIHLSLRLIQKSIYNTLCKKIFVDSDNNCKNWTKDQWDDPHKVYVMEDTPEKCNKAYDEWVNMKSETWHNLKIKVKESKLYRLLPLRIRSKLIRTEEKTKYYDKFIEFLLLLGISFDIDIIEKHKKK